MIHKTLGRLPELTIKEILKQTVNSVRRLGNLLRRLWELKENSGDRDLVDLIPVAGDRFLVPAL